MHKRSMLILVILVLLVNGCVKQNNPTSAPPIVMTSTIPQPTLTPATSYGPSIHDIQGASHVSPFVGQSVENIQGVVTTFRADGFYMQEPNPDADPSTSEGLFVFTQLPPSVRPGASVLVSGMVSEIYPGGVETGNLSITQIVNPKIVQESTGNPLPAAVIIGKGGRIPPSMVIDNDQMGDFDPQEDGLDFYESLESMLVQVNDAVVVGPTNSYKEVVIVADGGENSSLISSRGSIVLRSNDYNPERIILDDSLRSIPNVNVGDHFSQDVVGIIDYTFGNYKLQPIVKLSAVPSSIEREIALEPGDDVLSIAFYNTENLDGRDAQSRFDALGQMIVNNLKSPDILALGEIQDNNGAFADQVTDASETYQKIVTAIIAANGPKYEFRDIAPIINQDGGETGGNIRVGFLFRTDRGLSFIDKIGGDSHTPVAWEPSTNGPGLSFNPGRIDPLNSAFIDSRKPLAGEFLFRGEKVIVIANHFNSKGGDTYLFGEQQPPFLASEAQRVKQAVVVNAFVKKALVMDPEVNIVVLGDLNDFQFSKPLAVLTAQELFNLVMTLPEEEQYTYVYDGNAQVLDQILASSAMKDRLTEYDIVHINSEFYYEARESDHDPILARFNFSK